MKQKYLLLTMIILIFLFSTTSLSVLAVTPNLELTPDSQSVTVGNQANINVEVEEVTNLRGANITLNFDASKLQYISSTNGGFIPSATLLEQSIDNTNGSVTLDIAGLDASAYASGSGTIMTVIFNRITTGNTNITFGSTILRDKDNITITHTKGNGCLMTSLIGDFNADGCVEFEDLMIFAIAYGSCEGDANWNPVCDLNSDGCIEFEDLMLFAMHYGLCDEPCPPPSAPTLSDPGNTLTSPATYTVCWSSVSVATGYKIQEATSSNFSSGLQEDTLTAICKDFSHTVTTTTTYYYRVAAIDSCGQSVWSNVEDIVIVPPDSGNKVFLESGGTLNGTSINPSNPALSVNSGGSITGTLKVQAIYSGPSSNVVPFGYTSSWGSHSSSYVTVKSDLPVGTSTYNVSINLNAPTTSGTYYLIFASNCEMNLGWTMSQTNWTVGTPHWDDGNDIADQTEAEIGGALLNGYVFLNMWVNGEYKLSPYGITYVKINVTGNGYTLTTSVSPSGSGSVSLSPSGGTYNAGTSVTLTANPITDYKFDHWEGSATGTSNPTTITMNSNKNVIAYFVYDPTKYTLTTSVSPSGSGSVSPSGGTYNAGTSVTLTANHASGYKFDHWGGSAGGTSNPTTITMNSNKNVIAYFVPVQYTLTTSVSPSGSGYVTLSPSGGTYDAGTRVTITAVHYSGYEFYEWEVVGSGYLTSNPITVTVNGNAELIAHFVRSEYEIHTSVSPEGSGYVILDPPGGTYTHGTEVTLTAYPYSGYEFNYWGGDSTNYPNPLTITLGYSDRDIIAYFTENDPVYRAVCIGVSTTPGSSVVLKAPVYDVDRMRDMLSHCRFGSSNIEFTTIQYLKDDEATLDRVWGGISSLFSSADSNDVSYVYFSGHGGFIFPNKARIGLYDTSLDVDSFETLLSPINGTKVVILDSCSSGGFIGKGENEITKDDLINFNENVIDVFSLNDSRDFLTGSGYIVLTSCHYYQTCWETDPWFGDPYGDFTMALVQGCGYDYYTYPYWADNSGDRKISLQEACTYTEYWLANEAPSHDPDQDAQMYPEGSDFPIVEY